MPERHRKEKKTHLIALMLLILLANSTILCEKSAAASTGSGAVLDLFTQKVPFGGEGPNMPSDAFQPQELVILYANVTYNDQLVVGKLVSFQAEGPANAFNNITVSGTGSTNKSGLATFSFRVPWPNDHPEDTVFGVWFAIATVDIAQETVKDTLTFHVGWILQITSITTLNSELMPWTTFFREDVINFNVTVENIAMVEKPGTITIEVEDAAGYPIINIMKENLTFQPGENYANGSSWIPDTATIGNATVWAAIYTAPPGEGGVLYSPAISKEFEIAEKPLIHDIGIISITVSSNNVYAGDVVEIYVTAKNNGTATETFPLSAYYNSSLIGTIQINALKPNENITRDFSWNTGSTKEGYYQISAIAPLTGDPSPGDNTLTDGFIQIMTPFPSVVHDIGITCIKLSIHSTYIGGIVDIFVTILNNGTAPESFELSTYYNSSLIESRQVNALAPLDQVLVPFSWNTSLAKEGYYQISAIAPLTGDPSPGDNTLTDGFVQLKSPTKPVPYTPSILFLEVFFIFMSALGIIASLILLLMLGFLRRRRKKKLPRKYALLVHLHI